MIGLKPRQRNGNGNGNAIPPRVHLVGAGGVHMSAIGQILLARGHTVTGSDLAASDYTNRLVALGAEVFIGPHDASHVGDAQLVVATAAAKADNPELLIYVCVDEPEKAKGYYGGQVAAPAFRNIALRSATYLNIRPETAVGEAVTGVAQGALATNRTN